MTLDESIQMRVEREKREFLLTEVVIIGCFASYIGGAIFFINRSQNYQIPGVEYHQVGDYMFEFHCAEEEQRQANCATRENLAVVRTRDLLHHKKHCYSIDIYQRGNPDLQPRCSEPPGEESKLWELYSAYQSLEQRSEGEK